MDKDQELCKQCGATLRSGDAFCRQCGTGAISCPSCNEILLERGRFCHECGKELDAGVVIKTPLIENPQAYCPHCPQPRPLARRYRYCIRNGHPIHLYVEVNELSLYMQGVRTQTEFRIVPVCEQVTLLGFQVFLGKDCLLPGKHNIGARHLILEAEGPIQVDRLVHPAEPVAGVSEKCPPGDAMLYISLQYEAQGKQYELSGRHEIYILPRDADPHEVHNHFGSHIQQIGDGPKSGGAHSYNLDFRGVGGDSKAAAFIKELKKERLEKKGELNFRPAALHVQKITPVERKAPRAAVPVPDWPAENRARLWFQCNGVTHNYCLLSTWRDDLGAYGPVRLGRDSKWADIFLREVERYKADKKTSQHQTGQSGLSFSRVSERHWEIALLHDPQSPHLIQVTNVKDDRPRANGQPRTKRHDAMIAADKTLPEGKSCRRAPGDSIVLKAGDGAGNIIGLRYAANAPRFSKLAELYDAARGLLDRIPKKPAKLPQWPAQYGGYALSRLFSLTGEPIRGYDDEKTLEAYVLMPGWATIGSSRQACIVVPGEQVAGIHAYLLHVDGYYFVTPLDETTPVLVNGEPIPVGVPWPLKPDEAVFRIGSREIRFKSFAQHR